jgi:alpha-amylase/alpha-mannosidase (GH57 family)
MSRDRFVCIHGHFYQPPREDPWTGLIPRQKSAGEDHDWNARIARECYIPNARARIVGEKNETLAAVNNYAHISFNFGPTLLNWFAAQHPEDYKRLLSADRESALRLEGHGNAIAQAYSHMILPLADARDQVTQVRWGIADFRFRFHRDPEALWLPETAVDLNTLRVLIDHGLKYAILAPSQAKRVRRPGDARWTDVDATTLDTRHPYRWVDHASKSPRSIWLFFYDGVLSKEVAFGKLMASSPLAAQRLEESFDERSRADQLVSIATDGETYGHHDKFAEMGLAHLLKYEVPARKIQPVNFGYFLAKHRGAWEAEIVDQTAWSCSHGLSRWRGGCDCGSEGKSTDWREPLRDALDWLRGELADIAEAETGRLVRDFWEVRNDAIDIVLDPSAENVDLFCRRRMILPPVPETKTALLRMLECQKLAMYMYTSCGWFFSDVAGLEAVQNLRYAARAIELAEATGLAEDLEEGFMKRLEAVPCNDERYGDAEAVYRRLARPVRTRAMASGS